MSDLETQIAELSENNRQLRLDNTALALVVESQDRSMQQFPEAKRLLGQAVKALEPYHLRIYLGGSGDGVPNQPMLVSSLITQWLDKQSGA